MLIHRQARAKTHEMVRDVGSLFSKSREEKRAYRSKCAGKDRAGRDADQVAQMGPERDQDDPRLAYALPRRRRKPSVKRLPGQRRIDCTTVSPLHCIASSTGGRQEAGRKPLLGRIAGRTSVDVNVMHHTLVKIHIESPLPIAMKKRNRTRLPR
jgi:hypothetical protein